MRLLTGDAQKFDRPVGIRDPQQLRACSLPVALLAFEWLARRKNFLDVLLPVVHPREFRRRAAGLRDAMTAYRVAMSDKSSQNTTTETRLTTLDGAVVDVCLWDDQTWVTAFAVDASGNRGSELRDEAVKSEEDLRGFMERVGVDPARVAGIWASSTRPAYYSSRKSGR